MKSLREQAAELLMTEAYNGSRVNKTLDFMLKHPEDTVRIERSNQRWWGYENLRANKILDYEIVGCDSISPRGGHYYIFAYATHVSKTKSYVKNSKVLKKFPISKEDKEKLKTIIGIIYFNKIDLKKVRYVMITTPDHMSLSSKYKRFSDSYKNPTLVILLSKKRILKDINDKVYDHKELQIIAGPKEDFALPDDIPFNEVIDLSKLID